jgi:hypothetical protein
MLSTAAIVEALAVHEVIAVDDDDKGNTFLTERISKSLIRDKH